MDRRGRTVIDPKVRQVGFVTPGSDSLTLGPPAAAPIEGTNSPSPVIIPPVRVTDGGASMKAAPMPVPSPSSRRLGNIDMPTVPRGSYIPSDSVLGSSVTPSSVKDGSHGESLLSSGTFLELSSRASESVSIGGAVVVQDAVQQGVSVVAAGSIPPALADGLMEQGQSQKVIAEANVDGQIKIVKEKMSKAERRAIQEAQRAAKAAAREAGGAKPAKDSVGQAVSHKDAKLAHPKKDTSDKRSSSADKKVVSEKVQEKEKKKDVPAPRMQFDDVERVNKAKKRFLVEQTETKNRVELFRHLPQFVHGTQLPSLEAKFFHEEALHPHPAIYKVGLQYLTGDIVGGNARCVAMLLAFREMIKDYSTPLEKRFNRDLTSKINSHVSFLIICRPLAISMGNAIKFLKTRIVHLSGEMSEADAKASLIADIDRFIQEKIVYADKEIVKHAVQKIRDGDVCLTYSSSCVVEMILLRAHELGRKFRVVVVDSRPKLEGKRLLKRLLTAGIDCTYTYINAVSYIMQEATRVFLGAASVLSNGTVYSRVGTASVAMVAHAFSVPVMICCETYKFHERVQLDSITANELGDPDALVKVWGRKDLKQLEGWGDNKHLQLLNLTYDATPSDYVSMVITELGMVPPSSVPVILREYRRELPG